MYAIHATVTVKSPDGWWFTNQVPTFYLAEKAQEIVSEAQATKIALEILKAGSSSADDHFTVMATLVP